MSTGGNVVGLRKYVIEDILRSIPPSKSGGETLAAGLYGDFPVFKLMILDFLLGQVLIGPLITTCWRGAWISFNVLLDDYLFKVWKAIWIASEWTPHKRLKFGHRFWANVLLLNIELLDMIRCATPVMLLTTDLWLKATGKKIRRKLEDYIMLSQILHGIISYENVLQTHTQEFLVKL